MKVYIARERSGINAKGEFDPTTRSLTVLQGSVLSVSIAYTEKFRGAKSIEKSREGVVKGNILQRDVTFKSASTAANFVTGTSTNGLTAWKDKNGKTIKELIAEAEA
ncbi:MAG TPA: DUF4357 domain-containing protein [Candidatus Scatomonas merdigallinarum]|nr:DUF4357 domain-containing protein [Candidatus Scatomonas merdigallinarum]